MDSPTELKKSLLLLVAFETGIRAISCISVFKSKDESFPLSLDMFPPWAMARFTSSLVYGNFWIKYIFPVRVIFFETFVEFWMTPFASL
jgi:hypothetical protein